MALQPGNRLGPYEILAAIGAGGMGEVYRARDAKLGRDVALKVLPEAFVRDGECMARFQREAKVLASLNHPPCSTSDVCITNQKMGILALSFSRKISVLASGYERQPAWVHLLEVGDDRVVWHIRVVTSLPDILHVSATSLVIFVEERVVSSIEL